MDIQVKGWPLLWMVPLLFLTSTAAGSDLELVDAGREEEAVDVGRVECVALRGAGQGCLLLAA